MYGIVATWRIRVSEWIGKIRARSGEIGIQILYNRVLTNESSNRHPIINEVDRSQPKGRSLVSVPRIDSRATIENWINRVRLLKSHLILFEFFRNSVSNLTPLDSIFRDPWYSMRNDSIVRCDYLKPCKIWTRERESFSMGLFPPCRWEIGRGSILFNPFDRILVWHGTRVIVHSEFCFFFSVPSFAWNTWIILTEEDTCYRTCFFYTCFDAF